MHLGIRADADGTIGAGHIMRCLALAQAWQTEGGSVTFFSHCENNALKTRILGEGFGFAALDQVCPDPSDIKKTLSLLKSERSDRQGWLVLDGYHFTAEYQMTIRNAGISLLVIDDKNHLPSYDADIILNQNIHASDLEYRARKALTLLLGTNYVLLRREFLQYRGVKRQIPDRAENILVTLGGADPDNATLKVIEALRCLDDPDMNVKIAIGPANRHYDSISKALATARFNAELLMNPAGMPELMLWADLAVSSGGSTCWELAFMGAPAVVGRIADVEDLLINGLRRYDLFRDAGWFRALATEDLAHVLAGCMRDQEWRAAMNKRGPEIVDGFGSMRVLKAMRDISSSTGRDNSWQM